MCLPKIIISSDGKHCDPLISTLAASLNISGRSLKIVTFIVRWTFTKREYFMKMLTLNLLLKRIPLWIQCNLFQLFLPAICNPLKSKSFEINSVTMILILTWAVSNTLWIISWVSYFWPIDDVILFFLLRISAGHSTVFFT